MSELDNDELLATRRLHGLNDGLFKEETMTEEAFNELIDNFEVVAHLTPYGRKGIKENVKKLQARIKELEEDLYSANKIVEEYTDSIPVQKVKDLIEENNRIMKETQKRYPSTYTALDEWRNAKAQNESLEELLEENNK